MNRKLCSMGPLELLVAVGFLELDLFELLEERVPLGRGDFIYRPMSPDLLESLIWGNVVFGKAQYTLVCDEETGGVVDDLIAYVHSEEHVLLVPNAANSAEVLRRLEARRPDGIAIADDQHQLPMVFLTARQQFVLK